ncbi:MAG: hypothetical protein IJT12_09255 [Paludibacteraceae bacterium]|nr:hypothetical protein [Paludibacteraceae bacterium]
MSQNEGIEDKFGRHILYNYLSFVCKPIAAESQRFALKSGELFYHCVYSLDTLKGLPIQKIKEKCTLLWFDLVEYMHDKSISTEDVEVIHAISLIVYSVERCLLLTSNTEFTYPAGILQSLIQRYDSVFANDLAAGFKRAGQLTDIQAIAEWLSAYMDSPVHLSDELDKTLDTINQSHPHSQDKPSKEDLDNTFTYTYQLTAGYSQLIDFLRTERDKNGKTADADWARHALIIYEQNPHILKNRPNTFKEWLIYFCKIFGREWKRDYEPGKLRNKTSAAEKFMPPKIVR